MKYLVNTAIAIYLAAIAIYMVNGPTTFVFGRIKVRFNDLFTLVFILCLVLVIRFLLTITWDRKAVFAAIAVAISTGFTMAASELILRALYPQEMSPPPYIYNTGAKYGENGRGPYSAGPKKTGVKRIIIQGDSITWGAAVEDWKELYPYKLEAALNRSGEKYDMQVWAVPGMQVDFHAKNLALMGEEMAPDIIIYQWYVNDVEVWADRPPAAKAPWRKGKAHAWLENVSLMYRLVDSRLGALVYREGEQYADYLSQKILPGKKYWWYFEMEFHKWATFANSLASRTVLLLYPSLPFKSEYPFQKVTDSVIALTKPHLMRIPAAYLFNREGKEEAGLGSTYELARTARLGKTRNGHILFGPYIPFARGGHEAGFVMKLLSPAPPEAKVARLEVATGKGGRVLASHLALAQELGQPGQWVKITVPFQVEEPMIPDVEFRVDYLGECDLAVDTIDVPVDYRIEVVYPMEELKKFNTHARLFDAHPSPKAHSVLAEALARRLSQAP